MLDSRVLTFVNMTIYFCLVAKVLFGTIIHQARLAAGLSLREVAAETGLDFTRLSKIEHGTRPAPGLREIRTLTGLLNLDMGDLLVAAGTAREVVDELLWWERLHVARTEPSLRTYFPEAVALRAKNTFRVKVEKREGALCQVVLGNAARLNVLSFSTEDSLQIEIPPEGVTILPTAAQSVLKDVENVLPMRIGKIRRLGQTTNLILCGRGFELNALPTEKSVRRMNLQRDGRVLAVVPAATIHTTPVAEAR
jgi:transcriptional regulator with XRE-family HTH domain